MKKVILALSVTVLLMTGLKAQDNNPIRKDSNRIEVILTNDLTKDKLMHAKKELWEKDKIILDYNILKYNKEGKIEHIKITVDCKDGFKGTYELNDFKDDFVFGFYRDYNEGVNSRFGLSPYPFDKN